MARTQGIPLALVIAIAFPSCRTFPIGGVLSHHEVLRLDEPAIVQAMQTGGEVTLELGGQATRFQLAPPRPAGTYRVVVLRDEGREEWDEPETGIDVVAEIPGDIRGWGRFSWFGGDLLITARVGDGYWSVEPAHRFGLEPPQPDIARSAAPYIAYDHGWTTPPNLVSDEHQCQEENAPQGAPLLGDVWGLALVADSEFHEQSEHSTVPWHGRQRVLQHHVNAIFRDQLGYEFEPVLHIADLRAGRLEDTDAAALLPDLVVTATDVVGPLEYPLDRAAAGIELVHLTSGKDFDGDTIGRGCRPGTFSISQQRGFWVTPGIPTQPISLSVLTTAHEYGHNVDAVHPEADRWCAKGFLGWCWDHDTTLMWPTGRASDTKPWFSDGTRTAGNDNLWRAGAHRLKRNGMRFY